MRRELLALAGAIATLLAIAPAAGATNYQRPLKETFGSVEQPSFEKAALLAVDPATGDVLVGDEGAQTISRFHADGTPAPFAGLGTNVIDGKEGPGGKPCAEEPASCDKTPQSGIEIHTNFSEQITVDPVNGDILIAEQSDVIVIFSAEGKYLGELTAAGVAKFSSPGFGVAVDDTGVVYVSGGFVGKGSGVAKYVPSANPPTNADNVAVFSMPNHEYSGQIAVGTGPSIGSLFMGFYEHGAGPVGVKMNPETGEFHHFAEKDGFGTPLTLNPLNGAPILTTNNEAAEFDASGEGLGTIQSKLFAEEDIYGIAAAASGDLYVATGSSHVFVYGAPAVVPTVTASEATGITGTRATLHGTVDPEGLEASECFFEWGSANSFGGFEWKGTIPCEGFNPADTGEQSVHVPISGLTPNGTEYKFRLAAKNENGTERSASESFLTAPTVHTEAATGLGLNGATLHGTVRSEGQELSGCYFEWGLTSSTSYEHKAPCSPPAEAIEADFVPHTISAELTGLKQSTTYRFRLLDEDPEGTHVGEELTFTTFGKPQIIGVSAYDATQGSASLEAKVNPSGFGTHYRIEWGSTSSYGHLSPLEFEPFLGEGANPVRVSARLSGLAEASTYHYRVVATSAIGVVTSPDETLETLGSCGLPEGRCFELVSRPEAGPVATPGAFQAGAEMHFQAATNGPGALAYAAEAGYPDATKGAEVLYLGRRDAASHNWLSTQLSTPIVGPDERKGSGSGSGKTLSLSDDLSCGVAESSQLLTDDPATRLAYETGGSNFYRIEPDGSYTAITNLAPENASEVGGVNIFLLGGISADCGKVAFYTQYRYPGLKGGPYEWDEGTLRNLGVVPGPSGEVAVEANLTQPNEVSEDGSRVFFTAKRETSSLPEEIEESAIFAREDGTTTTDVSKSETSIAASAATYRWATPDGSKVFFSANPGLADESSPGGFYEYDFEKPEGERLTSLLAGVEVEGASVGKFLAASKDGSHVYFTSATQLIPGRGKSSTQNKSVGTESVYGESEGQLSYVGAVKAGSTPTAQASPDGRYLLFESSAKFTEYDSGGAGEAYIYDAEATTEPTICLSCRRDGQASVAPSSYEALVSGGTGVNSPLHPPQILAQGKDGPLAFFRSKDALAPGAVEGQSNLYEWSHGQLFRVTSEPQGLSEFGGYVLFAGASEDGSDLYFSTVEKLTWEDQDERSSVYDARVGGGFPEPPAPPAPCNPGAEGSCQGEGSSPGALPGAASASFSGPGNPAPQETAKKKKHKKKAHKKKRKHKRHAKKKHKRHQRKSRSKHKRAR